MFHKKWQRTLGVSEKVAKIVKGAAEAKYAGFTLVELIVVITILAILATVGFLALQGYTKDAKNAAFKTNVNLISQAIQLSSVRMSYPERRFIIHDPEYALPAGTKIVIGKDVVTLTGGSWNSSGSNYSAGTADFASIGLDPAKFLSATDPSLFPTAFADFESSATPYAVAAATTTDRLPSGKTVTVSAIQTVGKTSDGTIYVDGTLASPTAEQTASGAVSGLVASSSGSSTPVTATPEVASASAPASTGSVTPPPPAPTYSDCVESTVNGYTVVATNHAASNSASKTDPSFVNGTKTLTQSFACTDGTFAASGAETSSIVCLPGYTGTNCENAPAVGFNVSAVSGETAFYAGTYQGRTMWVAGTQSQLAWRTPSIDSPNTAVSSTDGRLNTGVNDVNYRSNVTGTRNTDHPAWDYCANLNWAGHSDWYLPTMLGNTSNISTSNCSSAGGEMQFLYCQHKGGGGQSLLGFSGNIWTSRQYSSTQAWNVATTGTWASYTGWDPKTTTFGVRCVRVAN